MSDFLLHLHTEKHCRLSDGYRQHSSCHIRYGSRTESCTEVATSKYRNGTGVTSTSFSRVESRLSFVSIDKTTFRSARPSIGSAAYTEDCRGEIHAFEHARLQAEHRWLRVGLSFISKTQVLDKGPKCVLSCTIPVLDRHLSSGMVEDRLLFPIWAL